MRQLRFEFFSDHVARINSSFGGGGGGWGGGVGVGRRTFILELHVRKRIQKPGQIYL